MRCVHQIAAITGHGHRPPVGPHTIPIARVIYTGVPHRIFILWVETVFAFLNTLLAALAVLAVLAITAIPTTPTVPVITGVPLIPQLHSLDSTFFVPVVSRNLVVFRVVYLHVLLLIISAVVAIITLILHLHIVAPLVVIPITITLFIFGILASTTLAATPALVTCAAFATTLSPVSLLVTAVPIQDHLDVPTGRIRVVIPDVITQTVSKTTFFDILTCVGALPFLLLCPNYPPRRSRWSPFHQWREL